MRVVLVFGSNEAGIHGKGAADDAHRHWGAEWGVGEGPTGSAYALPTKDRHLRTLPFEKIEAALLRFRDYAAQRRDTMFLLTPIGCGYAKQDPHRMADAVKRLKMPKNVVLTTSWLDHLTPAAAAAA